MVLQNNISNDWVLTETVKEELFAKTGSMGAYLNKEQWNEYPYTKKTPQVKAVYKTNNP